AARCRARGTPAARSPSSRGRPPGPCRPTGTERRGTPSPSTRRRHRGPRRCRRRPRGRRRARRGWCGRRARWRRAAPPRTRRVPPGRARPDRAGPARSAGGSGRSAAAPGWDLTGRWVRSRSPPRRDLVEGPLLLAELLAPPLLAVALVEALERPQVRRGALPLAEAPRRQLQRVQLGGLAGVHRRGEPVVAVAADLPVGRVTARQPDVEGAAQASPAHLGRAPGLHLLEAGLGELGAGPLLLHPPDAQHRIESESVAAHDAPPIAVGSPRSSASAPHAWPGPVRSWRSWRRNES